MPTPHQLINPETLSPAKGFTHAVVPADGKTVYLAGQIASNMAGEVEGKTFAEQYDLALKNVTGALKAAGGQPESIVSLVVYTTDMQGYRDSLREVGEAHRKHVGRHYPAMAMLGVTELFEPAAMVEIVAVAVVPDAAH